MNTEHLKEPLDYLYEELSPEGMVEARKHLAECPKCREEMRRIRETVKTYRQIPSPAAPAGLARRVAARALEEAHSESLVTAAETAAPASMEAARPAAAGTSLAKLAEPVDPKQEAEFVRLKEELLDEMRGGWRTWFFHPAWAVAASVIFICSLLIHFSPRSNRWVDEIRSQAESEFAPAVTERQQAPAHAPLPAPQTVPAPPPRAAEQEPPVMEPPMRMTPPVTAGGDASFPEIGPPAEETMEQMQETVSSEPAIRQEAAVPPPPPSASAMARKAAPALDVPKEAKEEPVLPAGSITSEPERDSAASVGDALPEANLAKQQARESAADAAETSTPATTLTPPVSSPPAGSVSRWRMEEELRPPPPAPPAASPSVSPSQSGMGALPPPASMPSAPAVMGDLPSSVTGLALPGSPDVPALKPEALDMKDAYQDTSVSGAFPYSYSGTAASSGTKSEQKTDGLSGSAEPSAPPPASYAPAADAAPSASFPASVPAPVGPEQQARYWTQEADQNSVFADQGYSPSSPAAPAATVVDEKTPGPVIVHDFFDTTEPPELIARPTPIDVGKLASDLTALAGMQIGSGEIADAWVTVGLLRRYDAAKADEFAAILKKMEEDASTLSSRTQTETESAEAVSSSSPPDKYYSPPQETASGAFGAASPALPGSEPAAPAATAADIPPPGPAASQPAEVSPPVSAASSESLMDRAAVSGPEYYIGPVYSADDPPGTAPAVAPETAPVTAPEPSPPSSVEQGESPAVDAPTVPKSSVDAVPPTLWESTSGSRFDRSRRIGRTRDSDQLPAWRRAFSTDPYVRDE